MPSTLEPLNTITVNIDELRVELAAQIFQTWKARLPVPSFNLHIEDLQGNSITLQGQDTVHKVLSSFRPGWFREQVQPSLPQVLLMDDISPAFFDLTAQAIHRNRDVQCKKRLVPCAS